MSIRNRNSSPALRDHAFGVPLQELYLRLILGTGDIALGGLQAHLAA